MEVDLVGMMLMHQVAVEVLVEARYILRQERLC